MGGLGNQMFQYAYGRYLGARGRDVYFSRALCPPNHSEPHKAFALDGFDIVARFNDLPSGAPIYERGLRFDPTMLEVPEPCIVQGYFQCEKYFQGISSLLRRDFSLKNPLRPNSEELAKEIRACNSVSVHVRRRDYLQLQAHPRAHAARVLPQGAAPRLRPRAGHQGLHFSDDPEWCAQNMAGTVVATGDKYEDMHLMSMCRHAVIVNSSYSWWGAWLNPDPDRVVVAPANWFATTPTTRGTSSRTGG